jgi:hypothetical protein
VAEVGCVDLAAVVRSGSGTYPVSDKAMDTHLIPKRAVSITKQMPYESNRGIGYTESSFAFLFRLIS